MCLLERKYYENEEHFLFHCSLYLQLSNKLIYILYNIILSYNYQLKTNLDYL